jgi:hypothetical protein
MPNMSTTPRPLLALVYVAGFIELGYAGLSPGPTLLNHQHCGVHVRFNLADGETDLERGTIAN